MNCRYPGWVEDALEPAASLCVRRMEGKSTAAPHSASRVGIRSGCAGSLGKRPHAGLGEFRDRHAGRAHNAVHDAAALASDGRARCGRSREERTRAGRAWCRSWPRQHRQHGRDPRETVQHEPGLPSGGGTQANTADASRALETPLVKLSGCLRKRAIPKSRLHPIAGRSMVGRVQARLSREPRSAYPCLAQMTSRLGS